MRTVKKVTIVSLLVAAVIGTVSGFLRNKKYEIAPGKMSFWECRKKDMKAQFLKMFRLWRTKKVQPNLWQRIFHFA